MDFALWPSTVCTLETDNIDLRKWFSIFVLSSNKCGCSSFILAKPSEKEHQCQLGSKAKTHFCPEKIVNTKRGKNKVIFIVCQWVEHVPKLVFWKRERDMNEPVNNFMIKTKINSFPISVGTNRKKFHLISSWHDMTKSYYANTNNDTQGPSSCRAACSRKIV